MMSAGTPASRASAAKEPAHADRGHRVMAVELERSGCNGETLCITGNSGLDVFISGSLDIHREGDHLTVTGHTGEEQTVRVSDKRKTAASGLE